MLPRLAGRQDAVLFHAIDENMARNPEKTRGIGPVPVVAAQGLDHHFPFQLLQRIPRIREIHHV